MSPIMLVLPILCPLIGGLIVLRLHAQTVRRFAVVGIMVAQLASLIPTLLHDIPTLTLLTLTESVRIVLQADAVSRLFAVLISLIWLFVAIFAFEYMTHEKNRERFFSFYLITLSALIGVCFSGNLITLYMFYEMMTLCSFPLVLHTGTKKAVAAAWRYLTYSVAGAALGLLGWFVLQGYCSTDLFTAGGMLDTAAAMENRELLLGVFLVMIIGFGCKAGMFPLHAWLPIAHPEAPAPASAVLSGLITKMGILAIIRVTYFIFGWEFLIGTWAQTAVLVLALTTIFMGSTLALRENILKKRLAYSTVSQVSYVIFGLMLMDATAMEGALFQAIFHALAKNTLFMAAGALIFKTHKTLVSDLRGVGRVYGITMWCFTLSSLSLVGIPPTGGFAAKWMLAQGAMESGVGTLGYVGIGILMLSALLTAGYLLSIVTNGFFPGADFQAEGIFEKKTTPLMWIALCSLTVAALVLGMFPDIVRPAVQAVVNSLF
ncbi:MAG: proton-conducting transporter membrane subunit [Eubacteriales bacterium]|nr:proton-conducting transporter membrane subunit [Eubacteriales bacterium]